MSFWNFIFPRGSFHLHPLAHLSADIFRLELIGKLRGQDQAAELEAAIVKIFDAETGGVVIDGRQLKGLDIHCRAALLNHDWRCGGRMTYFGPLEAWSRLGLPLMPTYAKQEMAEQECLQRCRDARPPMEALFRAELSNFEGGGWLQCLGSFWRPDACEALKRSAQKVRGDLVLDVGSLDVLSPAAEAILRHLVDAVKERGDRVVFVANQISDTGRQLHRAGIVDWDANYHNPHLACASLYPDDPPRRADIHRDHKGLDLGEYRLADKLEVYEYATFWRAQSKKDDSTAIVEFRWHGPCPGWDEESRKLTELRHPGLARVYAWGSTRTPHDPRLLYRITEDVGGESLEGWRPANVAHSVDLWLQGIEALAYLSHQGLAHHNLTRRTIRVAGGRLILTEMGARALPNYLECSDDMGDATFLGPDEVLGNRTASSGQYAAGALGYYLLTGQGPHPEDQNGDLMAWITARLNPGPIASPSELRPDIPVPLGSTVLTMLSSDPEQRYPDWQAAVAAVRQAAGE